MRKTSWVMGQVLVVVEWGLILGLCIPMLALDARAESLNVKPGAWEMTIPNPEIELPPCSLGRLSTWV